MEPSETRPSQPDAALTAIEKVKERNLSLDVSGSRRIRLRADLIIMPVLVTKLLILCMIYAIQFLDRSSLSYASIMGLPQDLHLEGQEYSWLGSIYFFGFLAAEVVTGRLLQRFPMGKYLSISAILWGVVLCCLAAVRSFQAAMAIRFILGFLQACVSPALILIIAQWYTRPEQIYRTALWVSANGFGQIFGGLVAYGLADGYKDYWTLRPWKVVFLLFGLIAVFLGFIALVFLPDSPLDTWWLSKEDRLLAVERLRANQQGIGNKVFKAYQLRELIYDPFTWMLLLFSVAANIPNGGLTNFFSKLIVSFNYTPLQAQLYSTPAGAVAIVSCFSWAFFSTRYQSRILAGIVYLGVAMIGVILMVAIPLSHPAGRLVGYYLTMAIPTGEAVVLSLISSNITGYTKKTTLSAIFFIGYCVGNIIGPQTFREADAPHYVPAEISIIVLLGVCIIDLLAMRIYFSHQNRKKEEQRSGVENATLDDAGFWDLTDRENPSFRYAL